MSRGYINLVRYCMIEACRKPAGPVCWIGEWGSKYDKDVWEDDHRLKR